MFGTPPAQGRQRPTAAGDLLVFLSLFAAVGWVLLSKRLMAKYASSHVTAMVMVTGTILVDAWVLMTSGLVNLEPALGALLGVIVLGETLGWSGVAGGAIIIGAAVAAAVRTT